MAADFLMNDSSERIREILISIPIWRGEKILGVEEISGGWTNESYKITLESGAFVLRLSGKNTGALGIDRAGEYQIVSLAGQMGIAPQVVFFDYDAGLMISHFEDGKILTPPVVDRERVMIFSRLLRRIHSLNSGSAMFCPFEKGMKWLDEAQRRGGIFPEKFSGILNHIREIRDRAWRISPAKCLCHNDIVLSNIIFCDKMENMESKTVIGEGFDRRLRVIDWEHAGMGSPLFDLATLSVNSRLSLEMESLLINTYFADSPLAALHDRAILQPFKMGFDFVNGAFYLLQATLARDGANMMRRLDYERGVEHHFSRLMHNITAGDL